MAKTDRQTDLSAPNNPDSDIACIYGTLYLRYLGGRPRAKFHLDQ